MDSKNTGAKQMNTDNRVKCREAADGSYEVYKIATGEVVSRWDSLYLARKSVTTINRNLGNV